MRLLIRDTYNPIGAFLRMMSYNIFETLRLMGVDNGGFQHTVMNMITKSNLRDIVTVKFYLQDEVYNEPHT